MSSISKLFWVVISLAGCLFFSAHSLAASYYKWVDEKGVSHFSEHPPQTLPAEIVQTQTRVPPPENSDVPDPSSEEPVAASEPEPENHDNVDPARCEAEEARLRQLTSGARLRIKNEQGELIYLEADQIKQEIEKSRQAVRESCG
jgi:hypothetical protein